MAIGIVFIRLVEHHNIVFCHHAVNIQLVIDFARRVIRIAKPQHFPRNFPSRVNRHNFGLPGEQPAGIFILTERRLGNHGLLTESLGNEINGLGGTAGHDDLVWLQAVALGYQPFQRPGLGFGVMGEQTGTRREVCHQLLMVCMQADIRRKVYLDALVFIYIVAVPFYHVGSMFLSL